MTPATILVVEDDAILAMHLEDILTRQGYTVLKLVATGEAALEAAQKLQPQMILMDIELAGEMNGIIAAQRIAAVADIPVIFLTGFSQDALLLEAQTAAPYGYLIKPAQERELTATIEMALYKHTLDRRVRLSEARYRTLIEQASDGIFLSDAQGNCHEVNSTGCQMLGYTRAELLKLNQRDFMLPEHKVTSSLKLPDQSRNTTSEHQFIRKDGSRFPVEISKKTLADGSQQSIARDITERKRMENTLQFLAQHSWVSTGEDFFLSLARFLAQTLEMDYVCIDRLVGDGHTAQTEAVYFDGKFEDNVVYTLRDTPCGDVVGKNICCFPKAVRQLFPRDLVLQEMVAESYMGTTLWNFNGQPIGLIAVIGRRPLPNPQLAESVLKLVAERAAGELEHKKAEEVLRASEARANLIYNSTSDSMFLVGVEPNEIYRCLSVNATYLKTTGLTSEQVIGKQIEDLVSPAQAEYLLRRYREAIECKHTIQYLEELDLPQGHSIVETTLTPILDSAGKCCHLLGSVRDISDRTRAEEQVRTLNAQLEQRVLERTTQLEAANKELEAFSYSVSHDLRAPLRALEGYSDILLSDYTETLDAEGRHYLGRIQEAARRMGQLINDLLGLSRITRSEFNRREVDLSALAQEVTHELQALNPMRPVQCQISPAMVVNGDPQLLKIVLINLLNNAFKFTSPRQQAQIQVGILQNDGQPVYFVRDNGVGFDMAYAGKLFNPFQRLHGAQEFPGTGIGLVTVQRIIHRHGGRIWPEAELDHGATFYFTLGEQE